MISLGQAITALQVLLLCMVPFAIVGVVVSVTWLIGMVS